MQTQDIRTLSNQQLEEELEKTYRELMNLRFRAATNQLTDTNQPRYTRKAIARLRTIIRERELAGG